MRTSILLICAAAVSAIVGFLLRGFPWGFVPGALIGAAIGATGALFRKRLCRSPSRRGTLCKLLVPAVFTAGLVYGPMRLLHVPTASEILVLSIGKDLALRCSGASSFCYWSQDPTFGVRFFVDQDGFEEILTRTKSRQDAWPRTATRDLQWYSGGWRGIRSGQVPAWWSPAEIADPRTYYGRSTEGVAVRIRRDHSSGLTYLELLYE